MASRKGYEPRAMVEALSALERGAAQQAREASREPKNGKSDPSPDDDFDPHPAPGARIARAAVAAGKGGGEWGRERYFARIGGLEWGEGSTTPVLLGSRYVVPGDLSFAVPRGYRAKSERGILEAKVSEEASLVAFRMQGSFISEALKASIAKGRNVTRDLAGRHAIVARAGTGEGKAAGTKTKKDDSLMRGSDLVRRWLLRRLAVDVRRREPYRQRDLLRRPGQCRPLALQQATLSASARGSRYLTLASDVCPLF